MKIHSRLMKDKILIYAILFSAVWHIFWLSAFKVVVVPRPQKQVKFSNVSFLGPILAKGAISLSVQPHQRTILENNYIDGIEKASVKILQRKANDDYAEAGPAERLLSGGEDDLVGLTLLALDDQKSEPGRDID